VDISGSGGATVAPRDELSAQVSGAGEVEYIGDPRISQHVSGDSSVRRRP
jgi:hypothetical protein